ncbi:MULTISPECIES: sugar porter family MFS transporter [Olivibacter]|uniref:Sugar porter family MFS transporter n=1 Tax=Olivibacter oleidegradans TaxID=760123 RepID=A0ABV6HNZ3_9SPHI|nr:MULTISPECIES: sugar porter family MFS transporter [unclassified Olivibacter]MDM8173627.1 sugar porter family MFS transporter [Olivibacter sp. 47]MDX3914716.1 sugar porter family MFS transporter [Pseudosphingobacterium sp.]QEL03340.1 sugar porter family MFS transporter [Olivibacter sp. LS-1]
MKNHMVKLWSVVVALGGFLFGFDTAVISGAEKAIEQYWQLTIFEHGFTISVALIGTVIGSLLGSYPTDKLGRKKTLYLVALAYLFASLGTAFTTSWHLFVLFRFIGGLGVGASSVTAPIYISEIAPSDRRGALVGLFQFNVVLGILISYLSNYLINQLEGESWRLMLGIQAVPSLLFLIAIYFIRESPRWLLTNGLRREEAIETLSIINPLGYQQELIAIENTAKLKAVNKQPALFVKAYRRPLVLAGLFALFNQFSGINAIIYYAPRIFEMAGLGVHSSLLSTIGIGMTNFVFTLLAVQLIDKVGRRMLMKIGSIGIIISLLLVVFSFNNPASSGMYISLYFMLFIACFAFSQGAVIWVFIAEIFPNQVRAKGQTFGSSIHWILAALVTFSFPILAEALGGMTTFLFFAIMMVLQLVFVIWWMPETKGISLEAIEAQLANEPLT